MKNKVLKKVIASLCIVVYCISSLGITSIASSKTNKYTNEQMALREVANAYYNKGIKAQYCTFRKSFTYSPEEATTQNTIYSVCSDYIFSTYYQAFGIRLPFLTNALIAYAEKYYDSNNIKTNDVIEYWQVKRDENGKEVLDENGNKIYEDNEGNIKNINLSTAKGRREYGTKLLTEYNLQVGDIIVWFPDGSAGNNTGHALLVYDIIYDGNGQPVDAIIRESTPKYEKETTKITSGLSYDKLLNENNDIYEGTFQERFLKTTYTSSSEKTKNSTIYNASDKSYFAIIRPLLKDENENYTGKYYYATFKSANTIIKYECVDRTLTNYEMTDSAEQRIQYSGIDIEKTVDVFNNSIVNLGDTLNYVIRIKNNSDNTYGTFDVVENISDYVEVIDNGNGSLKDNTLVWNIQNLNGNESIEIKYKVKVKENISNLGKKINSTGTVAGIPTSTVNNMISSNLSEEQKANLASKMKSIIVSKKFSGQNLISELYNEAFGVNLNLENLIISDLVKTRSGTQYYAANSSNYPTIYLNKENDFAKMIVSNYFGALNTSSTGNVSLKYWENSKATLEGRCERADTIYNENFRTGDILIYQNVQEANDSVTYKTENGTYYLIYISEKDKIQLYDDEIYGFIGINEENEINHISTDFKSLQTLLGKDYYVILRPSMSIDIIPMDLKVGYSTTDKTNEDVEVTITSNEEMLEVDGWTLSSNRKNLTKIYTTNKVEDVTIYDLYGNPITKRIKIENIDKNQPGLDVNYSTTQKINKDITVTIESDEQIQEVDSWKLSDDKKVLTKVYSENKEENVTVLDLAGNKSTVTIKVENIDKIDPTINIKYSTLDLTQDNVLVEISANEIIQEIEGWKIKEDRKTLYKYYTQNEEETVTINDLAGNTVTKTIKIGNIDRNQPGLDVNYSTTQKTNQDIIATITSDEQIQEVNDWNLSDDKKVLTKVYSENKEENVTVLDLAGNESTVTIKVENIDKIDPIINIKYSTLELTQDDVLVEISANEIIQEIEGWQIKEDKKTLYKYYTQNEEETVTIYDLAGNTVTKTIKIGNIDRNQPGLDVNYSTTQKTNQDIIVTITSDEQIQEVNDWSLSDDKKVLTKVYSENKEENVTIFDLAGNRKTVTIKIENIDKINPIINIKYSTLELTQDDVLVEISANEIIQEIEGWQIKEDKKTLYKHYTQNEEETVIIYDLAGNSVTKTIKIENIDKEKPEYVIEYSTTLMTNQDVVVTITANEKIQRVDGWELSNDKKILTKKYTKNEEDIVKIIDIVGNAAIEAIIKISNIDKTMPVIDIEYSDTEITNQDIIVTITSDEKIKEIESWNLSNDEKVLTKRFLANGQEELKVYDLAGNCVQATIEINNIDKIAPTVEVAYSDTLITDKDVTVTIKATKKIKSIKGWILSTDETELTKVFKENTEEIVEIEDIAGNKTAVTVKVSNILKNSQEDEYDETDKDPTISDKDFPYAGKVKAISVIILLLAIFIITNIKVRKYKDLK